MRSSFAAFLRGFVLPFGATTGERIFFDGTNGEIIFYNTAGNESIVIGRPTRIFRLRGVTFNLTEDPGFDALSAFGTAGTTRRVLFTMQGPEVTSGARPYIRLESESEDHTLPPVIELGSFDGGLAAVRGPRIVIPSSASSDRPQFEVTLVAGTATRLNDLITASTTRLFLSRRVVGGTPGFLSYTTGAGTCTINSTSATDTSTISVLVLNTDD